MWVGPGAELAVWKRLAKSRNSCKCKLTVRCLQRELDRLIAERIEDLRDNLEQPDARSDWLRGQLHALREMRGLMEEAAKAAEQGNR